MAILKLKPSCKDYLWGGTRLRTEFGIEYDKDPLAESWELSCHPDAVSYTHLTLPTMASVCRSRWSPYH